MHCCVIANICSNIFVSHYFNNVYLIYLLYLFIKHIIYFIWFIILISSNKVLNLCDVQLNTHFTRQADHMNEHYVNNIVIFTCVYQMFLNWKFGASNVIKKNNVFTIFKKMLFLSTLEMWLLN